MLQDALRKVYTYCKLHFFYRTCTRMASVRERFDLTQGEAFCMEAIMALERPTVAQFSHLMGLSTPNAASRIKSLVRKGCLRRVQSQKDKREFYLEPAEEYVRLYHDQSDPLLRDLNRAVQERFSPEEAAQLERMLEISCDELLAKYILNG